MIQLRSFANQCGFMEKNGKYYIIADNTILLEITKHQYDNPDYQLLHKEFRKYLDEKYPSFYQIIKNLLNINKLPIVKK